MQSSPHGAIISALNMAFSPFAVVVVRVPVDFILSVEFVPVNRIRHFDPQRRDNPLESLPSRLQKTQDRLTNTRRQFEEAKAAVDKPFPHEEDLSAKSSRLAELDALPNIDKPVNEIVDGDRGEDDSAPTMEHNLER